MSNEPTISRELFVAEVISKLRESEKERVKHDYLTRFGNGSGDDAKAFSAGWEYAMAFCCRSTPGDCFCGCHESTGLED